MSKPNSSIDRDSVNTTDGKYWARALYEYKSDNPEMLCIKSGEDLFIYRTLSSGWSFGQNKAHKGGYFPTDYITKTRVADKKDIITFFGELNATTASRKPKISIHTELNDSDTDFDTCLSPTDTVNSEGSLSTIGGRTSFKSNRSSLKLSSSTIASSIKRDSFILEKEKNLSYEVPAPLIANIDTKLMRSKPKSDAPPVPQRRHIGKSKRSSYTSTKIKPNTTPPPIPMRKRGANLKVDVQKDLLTRNNIRGKLPSRKSDAGLLPSPSSAKVMGSQGIFRRNSLSKISQEARKPRNLSFRLLPGFLKGGRGKTSKLKTVTEKDGDDDDDDNNVFDADANAVELVVHQQVKEKRRLSIKEATMKASITRTTRSGSRIALPLDIRLDIESFSIKGYAAMYFNRKQASGSGRRRNTASYLHSMFGGAGHKTNEKLNKLLSFAPISMSTTLNYLPKQIELQALQIFESILRYMGDGRYGERDAGNVEIRNQIAQQTVLGVVPAPMGDYTYQQSDFADEIYCQLMKQTSHNPNKESERLGWELLVAVSALSRPSVNLYHYVVNHMITKCYDASSEVSGLAFYALNNLYSSVPEEVTNATLAEAMLVRPATRVFEGGSVDQIVLLESIESFIHLNGLKHDGSPLYGSNKNNGNDNNSIVQRPTLSRSQGSSSSIASISDLNSKSSRNFLQIYRILFRGATIQIKKIDEKSYSERWIQLKKDEDNCIGIYKSIDDSKPLHVISVNDILHIDPVPPKIFHKKYEKEHGKSFKLKTFSIYTTHKRGIFDVLTPAEPERYLWVFGLNSLLSWCRAGNVLDQNCDFQYRELMDDSVPLSTSRISHKIPRILEYLVRRIIELDGCDTEGIFRIAASSVKIDLFIKSLNNGFYDKLDDCNDPMLSADLLKRWVRGLNPSLIPPELYKEAVEAGRLGSIEECIAVVDRLNASSRATMIYLIKFLCEIAKHSDKNLMGASNLAVVFSPNILKDPDQFDVHKHDSSHLSSLDIAAKIQQSLEVGKIERMFISLLISHADKLVV